MNWQNDKNIPLVWVDVPTHTLSTWQFKTKELGRRVVINKPGLKHQIYGYGKFQFYEYVYKIFILADTFINFLNL